MARHRMSWLMVASVLVLFVGCQSISEDLGLTESPTEPEPVATVAVGTTVGAISIPVILPASNPTPTPAPAPAPPAPGTPAPAPTPEPAPLPGSGGGGGGGGGGCNLPAQSPSHSCSRQDYGVFYRDVDEAMTRVIQKRPGLFKLSDDNCGGCPYIKDHNAYTDAVAAELQSMGYCAFYDGEEMAVKNTNNYSEQYDISTSKGYVRRGEKIYRATCWPAWF